MKLHEIHQVEDDEDYEDEDFDDENGELGFPHRKITIPMSKFTYEHVGRIVFDHKRADFSLEEIPVQNLRATQDWIADSWTPKSASPGAPTGIKTPDGLVHLFDGHHRAEHAIISKQGTVKVSVIAHDLSADKYK
jgi:hypothetical protein